MARLPQNYCFVCASIALFLLISLPAIATETWTGRCIGVIDGDTITVLRGTDPVKIQLHGIDTPESKPFSSRARQFTAGLVLEKTVTVHSLGNDRCNRAIARVFVGSTNVNHKLVEEGFAWWYRECAPNERELERLESEAKAARRGLWTDPNPVPPWEWRRNQRKRSFFQKVSGRLEYGGWG